MRWILITGLLLASQVQAEKLPESTVQYLAAKVKAACLRAPIPSDMGKEVQVEMCSCAERSYVANMLATEFSSARKPSEADKNRAGDLEEKAVAECYIPLAQQNVETSALADCMADAKMFPSLRKLTAAQLKPVCSCAASRYSKSLNYRDKSVGEDKAAAEKKMAALWLTTLEACVANKP